MHFESGRPVEEGAYLKPYKRLLVDVTATGAVLIPALELANMLFRALEVSGYRVVLASGGRSFERKFPEEREKGGEPRQHWQYPGLWSPAQPTLVYIGEVPIGLSIVEMSEEIELRYVRKRGYIRASEYVPPPGRSVDDSDTIYSNVPSGRFRIIAYSPFTRIAWSLQWQDTKAASLRSRIRSIVKEIEQGALILDGMIKQAEHEAESLRLRLLKMEERRRREEDRKRVGQSVVDSRNELQEMIERWRQNISIEQFLKDVVDRAQSLSAENRDLILSRLELARNFIGTQDPLDFIRRWKTPEERYAPQYPISDED